MSTRTPDRASTSRRGDGGLSPRAHTGILPAIGRRALAGWRRPTARVGRVAGRLSAVSSYALDLVVWSRILTRPSDLAQHSQAMERRGVAHPAPRLFVTAEADDASVWEEGFDEVYRLLLANLQAPDLISARRYARPSPAFQGVYLWDSAFIAQIWKAWDLDVAVDVNRAVLDRAEPDGRLPHVTTHLVESAFSQPPLVAWSLWELHRWGGDERTGAMIGEVYPALVRYHRWLQANRRLELGLYAWEHPYESGVENAPRFSSRDESFLADTTTLAAPDFSSYVILQTEALSSMARLLGRDDEAAAFDAEAAELRALIDEHLWHDEDRTYYDLDTVTGRHVRSHTIASLMPLWAGVPGPERAEALREHAVDPARFGTRVPLPSVARDDPEFSKDMWRGSTWVNTAYAALEGLVRYGYRDDAAELAARLVDGVYRTRATEHRLFEFYDPERHDIRELHRKKGNWWKFVTLGGKPRAEFVGWTGLVNTLVLEYLVGYGHDHGRPFVEPNLPPSFRGRALSIRIPSLDRVVEVARLDGTSYELHVWESDGVRRTVVEHGTRLPLDEIPLERGARRAHR